MIWICTGNKNRSSSLLKHLVASAAGLPDSSKFGLSVFDCGSDDIEELEIEIRKIWIGPLVFHSEKTEFSRSLAFNKAIAQCPGNLVFVCDADISLPENLHQKITQFCSRNSAWFPVCQWQLNESDTDWKWFSAGTGIFAATKKQLRITGLLNENMKNWGGEDWDLFFRFYKSGIMPLRSRCDGLYHHWHQPTKPENFQNIF